MKARTVGAISLLASCTSLSGLTTTAAQDAGEIDAAAAPYDAAPAADAGPIESSLEASFQDASPDARFCARQTGLAFCSDFDLGPIAADWPSQVNTVDGGLAIVTGGAASPPSSLLVSGVALASTTSAEFVEVDRKFGTAGHITYAFDVRVDTLDSNGASVELAAVAFTTGPTSYSAYHITAQLSGWLLGEETHHADGGADFVPTPLPGTLAASWTRVEMDIALDATPRTVTVRRDGVVAGTRTIPNAFPTGPLHIYVGIVYAHGPAEPAVMHFDNVTLRLADGG